MGWVNLVHLREGRSGGEGARHADGPRSAASGPGWGGGGALYATSTHPFFIFLMLPLTTAAEVISFVPACDLNPPLKRLVHSHKFAFTRLFFFRRSKHLICTAEATGSHYLDVSLSRVLSSIETETEERSGQREGGWPLGFLRWRLPKGSAWRR